MINVKIEYVCDCCKMTCDKNNFHKINLEVRDKDKSTDREFSPIASHSSYHICTNCLEKILNICGGK